MDREVTLFTKPEELIAWLDDNDLLMGLSENEAKILLDYMEGHDYAIGCDAAGKMVRKDIAEENGEVEDFSIDEVIDAVCNWNYELILEADSKRNNPKDFVDFSNEQSRYERLKSDEQVLDRLFDKTIYGQQIADLGRQIAEEFIKNLKQNKDISESAAIVAEEVRQYSTGNRGR